MSELGKSLQEKGLTGKGLEIAVISSPETQIHRPYGLGRGKNSEIALKNKHPSAAKAAFILDDLWPG
jgi:hypothetical protein